MEKNVMENSINQNFCLMSHYRITREDNRFKFKRINYRAPLSSSPTVATIDGRILTCY